MERVRGMRTRRRLGLAVSALFALVAVGSASASQPSPITRSSTFDSNAEGWIVQTGNGVASPTWSSAGGQPGGYITYQLDPPSFGLFQSTGDANGGTWPSGNALGDYGGTLKIDLRATDPNSDALVGFFSSNTSVLPCVDLGAIGTSWGTYSITLDTSHLVDCGSQSASPLTGAQARAALASFQAMFVSPFDTDSFAETVDLDNAALAGPESPVTPPTGTVSRVFLPVTYRAHKFHGTLAAPNDYSCAGKTRVTLFRKARHPVKVGTAMTSAPNLRKGFGPATFSLRLRTVVKGSYYATVAKSTSSLDGNTCSRAKSKSVSVR